MEKDHAVREDVLRRAPLDAPEVHDAAASCGLSWWRTLWRIELPLAWPGILSALVLTFAHTLGEFGVVLMVGGNIPGHTKVLSIVIYESVETLDYGTAHILSAGLLVFSFAVLLAVGSKKLGTAFNAVGKIEWWARQITGWLVFDHAFLLAAGLLAGGAIGTLIAALVVPHATLTSAGVPVVPPPVLIVPWDAFALLLVVAPLVLLLLSVLLAARQIARRSVTDVLREQEV